MILLARAWSIAADIMTQYKMRRLPVVQNGKVIGKMSQADVAKSVPPDQARRMLTTISKD